MTDIERGLCEICADRKRMVTVTVDGERRRINCGGPHDHRCPGFRPAHPCREDTEVRE